MLPQNSTCSIERNDGAMDLDMLLWDFSHTYQYNNIVTYIPIQKNEPLPEKLHVYQEKNSMGVVFRWNSCDTDTL
jgi:hypothetical protein